MNKSYHYITFYLSILSFIMYLCNAGEIEWAILSVVFAFSSELSAVSDNIELLVERKRGDNE